MSAFERLEDLGVRDIIVLDAEYVSRAGEAVQPVCVCAKSLISRREWRIFHEQGAPCPFPVNDETVLFVSFSAPSEWSYFLAAGWELPSTIIDLFVERMLETNGKKNFQGKRDVPKLITSLTAYGIPAMDAEEKQSMREIILRGGPYSETERAEILAYCMGDVEATEKLLLAMIPHLSLEQAIVRGNYTRAVAHVEFNGIPVDVEMCRKLEKAWPRLKERLIAEVEETYAYGVYKRESPTKPFRFDEKAFAELVQRLGLHEAWPKTERGKYQTSDSDKGGHVFKRMAELEPYLEPLRVLRNTLNEMKVFKLPIGADGRVRTTVWPFWTETGRNQPGVLEETGKKGKKKRYGFLFTLPKWFRFLIKPELGRAVAYVDVISEEAGIAAALSNDPQMKKAYGERDMYLGFAYLAGAAPRDATKETHGPVRKKYKTALLGSLYGQTVWGLKYQAKISIQEASDVLAELRRVFAVYFTWSDNSCTVAAINKSIATPMGWKMRVGRNTKPNKVLNFPMQATGADILHLAAYMMADRGIELLAMVHDAVLVGAPVNRIKADCEIVRECWAEASRIVLDGFELKSSAEKIVCAPDRYSDEDGAEFWARVTKMLAEMPDAASDPLFDPEKIEAAALTGDLRGLTVIEACEAMAQYSRGPGGNPACRQAPCDGRGELG